MNRFLVATTGALFLATTGCGNTEEPEKKECQLEAFDLSACDRSGFATVKTDGIWHVNVSLSGSTTPGAMSLREQGLLFGVAITERQVGGDTFFLGSDFQPAGYQPLRFALAGCQSPTPEQVTGEFRRCVSGAADLKGTFEAVRLTRLAGEAEGSGLELVSEVALPRGSPVDVFVAGGYAYVAAEEDGLFVYKLNGTAVPEKVAEVSAQGDLWHQVWVKGQTLYVASGGQGLLVYDVSRPQAPKWLKALPSSAVEVWGLFGEGDRLYAMSPSPRAEVLIYDTSTPDSPLLKSRYIVEDSNPNAAEVPFGGMAFGNRLYIGHWRYGLAVTDVTDVTKPAGLGRFRYENAASRPVAVGTIGDKTIAFESSEGWGSRIRALDVTDPKNITEVGGFALRPESTVSGLTLVGSRLYVAHNLDGLRVLDVSDPRNLKPVAYYNTWRETDPGRGRAFLDGLSGVKVPGDGFIYATDTSRGLLVFREP
jgi:hypothetical protein